MKRSRIRFAALRVAIVSSLVAATVVGCQNMNNTQKGAGLGAGLGALIGAIIGHQTGNKGAGAAIGAVVGGTGGALAGHAQDSKQERDAALEYAHHESQMRQAEQRAMTNSDVVKMVQSQVSDATITSTIQDRGGKFDLHPDAIIALTKSGVSPHIIEAMRHNNYTPR